MATRSKTTKLKIREVAIGTLKPAPYNPRVNLQPHHKEYQDIKASLESYGFVLPLLFSHRKYIIGGAHRLKVAKALGYKKVPVVDIRIPNLKKEKALNSALNKVGGLWDPDKLTDLRDQGVFDGSFPTGFSTAEIEALGRRGSPPPPRNSVPDDNEQIFQVVVDVNDRDQQAGLVEEMQERGLEARAVTI